MPQDQPASSGPDAAGPDAAGPAGPGPAGPGPAGPAAGEPATGSTPAPDRPAGSTPAPDRPVGSTPAPERRSAGTPPLDRPPGRWAGTTPVTDRWAGTTPVTDRWAGAGPVTDRWAGIATTAAAAPGAAQAGASGWTAAAPDEVTPVGDQTAVVQWGEQSTARPRRALPGALAHLRRDRRLVPAIAGIGALVLFASLIAEWQVTLHNTNLFNGSEAPAQIVRAPSRLSDLGAWGSGYLTGLLMLAGTMAMLLFGPANLRRPARVLALSTAAAMLALLVAVTVDLGRQSFILRDFLLLSPDSTPEPVAYGRGLICAFFGVIAVAVAARLADRFPVDQPISGAADAVDRAGSQDGDGPNAAPDGREASFWGRPGHTADPAEPLDLTVEPTAPFTGVLDRRDGPA